MATLIQDLLIVSRAFFAKVFNGSYGFVLPLVLASTLLINIPQFGALSAVGVCGAVLMSLFQVFTIIASVVFLQEHGIVGEAVSLADKFIFSVTAISFGAPAYLLPNAIVLTMVGLAAHVGAWQIVLNFIISAVLATCSNLVAVRRILRAGGI